VEHSHAHPSVLGTTRSERELSQLTRLVVVRVGIAVPDWVRRCVERGVANATARTGPFWSIGADKWRALDERAEIVGWKAAEEVEGKVLVLLAAVEDLRPIATRVLAVLQGVGVPYPTGVLRQAHVPKAKRDRWAIKLYPDDPYNIMPRSLAELHPMVPELVASWEQARFGVLRDHFGA
jgi:hypothetical protein